MIKWALNSKTRTEVVDTHSEFRIVVQWTLNSEIRTGIQKELNSEDDHGYRASAFGLPCMIFCKRSIKKNTSLSKI